MWRGNVFPAAILMAGMVLYGLWVSVSMTSPSDYHELLTDDVFLESLTVSSYVAIVSTGIALIIGVMLARILSRTRLAALLAIPLFIPHLGAAYLAILY
ncbi:MAG: ABC transporter permease, partial [Exiguobacterium sp.]